jgi:anti-sigma factor RsiW
MNTCARVEEVEDMVLGVLGGAARRAIEEHLASCAECREARADFEEERALFAVRPPRASTRVRSAPRSRPRSPPAARPAAG